MWRKKDSDNLESIAKSLEKLVEREYERQLLKEDEKFDVGLLSRMRNYVKKDPIKVTDTLNIEIIEDAALEEELKLTQRMNSKISEAKRDNNSPFWAEDLFDEEELEVLES